MRGGRTDRNHAEIRDALRKVTYPVEDMSHVGKGFPDLIARHRLGRPVFLEVKDGLAKPSARRLTEQEDAFSRRWPGDYVVVLSVADALHAIGY